MIRLSGPAPFSKALPPAIRSVRVDARICHFCGACVAVCPPDALFLADTQLRVNPALCVGCGKCVTLCPVGALTSEAKTHAAVI